MRIVIQNLPHDVSEDRVREALSAYAPVEKVTLIVEGDMPTAVIEMEMTRAEATALARRISGHIYHGQRLQAWVPRWNG
ncbi:RNA-binding protein [Cupriavidus sp. IK-TO18]|uniref:RNA-binding protein n=1 Tax=Cupriavidus sp. IK-TO18 TaxID=2782182 RepID=UPI0018985EED|nr:RNA-binding protein [Cupriavidus sp. IK-TO18]MBF6989590.1 RNA-binding protein [Cupriavidus sp. IK-TO18]